MIIDSHTHINLNSKNKTLPENLIESMEKVGIDFSVLIAGKFGDFGATVEEAIQVSKKYPRLKPIGYVEYKTLTNSQITKLFNLLKRKKIYGIKFYPGYEDFYPADSKLFPIYEFCQKNNYPIIFHTGVLAENYPGLLKQAHPLNIDEIATGFPKLKIIMAHFGNPWLADCAAILARHDHVYADLSGYFTENSKIANDEKSLFVKQLTDFKIYTGDFRKCLFGTDWPLYDQKDYLKAVNELPISKEERDFVFWKNSKELFQLLI